MGFSVGNWQISCAPWISAVPPVAQLAAGWPGTNIDTIFDKVFFQAFH